MTYKILDGVNVESFDLFKGTPTSSRDFQRQTIGLKLKDLYTEFSIKYCAGGYSNDGISQLQLKNIISDYMRDLVGTREISRYYVLCDARNNNARIVENFKFLALAVEYVFPCSSNIETVKFIPVGEK